MGKDPSIVATLIVTLLLFAFLTVGIIWVKIYLDGKNASFSESTDPGNEMLKNLMQPEEDNIRQGNMVFKAVGILAVILLIVYISYAIAGRKSSNY